MTLHLSLPGSRSSHEQQEQIREAKRIMKEQIRSDWEFGTLPQHVSSGRARSRPGQDQVQDLQQGIAGFRFHTPAAVPTAVDGGVLGLSFEPIEWRERTYSDAETDDDGMIGMGSESTTSASKKLKRKIFSSNHRKSSSSIDGKFESPDTVGAELAAKRIARKRKRQTVLAEEAQWNDGLAHWLRRRDVWCGARAASEVQQCQQQQQQQNLLHSQQPINADTPSTPRTSTSTSNSTSSQQDSTSTTSSSCEPTTTSTSTPDSSISDATPTQPSSPALVSPPTTSEEILLPLAPSILPNHPIRQRITPAAYPEIYSKIILQSRTPAIPLNLRTLVHALVAGWKADDEWPPKPGVPEKSIASSRKKNAAAGKSMSGNGAAGAAGAGAGAGGDGALKSGVKAVGRALRIG